MNITKNVQYLKIRKDMFDMLCGFWLDLQIEKIQERCRQLQDTVNKISSPWIRFHDEELYLYARQKILVQDTQKLKRTYWGFCGDCNYNTVLSFMDRCTQADIKKYRDMASQKGGILPEQFDSKIAGLPACGMTRKTAMELFKDTKCPLLDNQGRIKVMGDQTADYIVTTNSDYSYYSPLNNNYNNSGSGYTAVKLSVHYFSKEETLFQIAMSCGLIPECLSEQDIQDIKALYLLSKDGVDVTDSPVLKSYIINNNIKELMGVSLGRESIEDAVLQEEFDLTQETGIGALMRRYLDECDFHRARIETYNSRWYLYDEGKGHWELWNAPKADESEAKDEDSYMIHIKEGIIARNPLADVNYDAVVGIDFGTKSTIVVVQNGDENIIPMRIGMADYLEKPLPEHYENPTVLEFVDISSFCHDYGSKEGRPYTSWDDVKISHTAFQDMIGAKKSRELASFVSDLKQWAGGRYRGRQNGRIIIRDKKGVRCDLNDYISLADEDLDPIEIYAYYLGLYINNMHTGIYLDYILSFPESFSLEVRDKLLLSFSRGIKRSLPAVIFSDEVCAASFRVRQGPSEPAAYAACALEQYSIEPDEDGVFYGIFDFGGGTTDFDFGIWKCAPEDEFNYNYIIKHFGSGGDKSLGGENLLELLAYHIFSDDSTDELGGKSNLQKMRENKLVYYRPEEGKIYPGAEALLSTDESAVLNLKQLMEVIRPIWEENEVFQSWSSENVAVRQQQSAIKLGDNNGLVLKGDSSVAAYVCLFDEKGDNKVFLELNVNMEMVNTIINERIDRGVRNFFEALSSVIRKKKIRTRHPIHIFLAGNSSRSRRVSSCFSCYMQIYEEIMFDSWRTDEDDENEAYIDTEYEENDFLEDDFVDDDFAEDGFEENSEEDSENSKGRNAYQSGHFILFPPLGTEEAQKIRQAYGLTDGEDSLMSPTGKTGVAFGLVMCREGSMIRVESELKKTEQIKMNYYIGINYRKNFKVILDRSVNYNKWLKFLNATGEMETFEFYFTDIPEAATGSVEIKNNVSIHKRKCLVDQSADGANIYFRMLGPSQLEYVVANKDKVDEGEYISSIYRVSL